MKLLKTLCAAMAATIIAAAVSPAAGAYMTYEPVYKMGDIDNSGEVLASDALQTLQCAVGKITLDYDEQDAADADEDWSITASDALMVLQCAVGKTELSHTSNAYESYNYKYVEPAGLEAYKMYIISSGSCFTLKSLRTDYDVTRLAACIQGLINRNNDRHHVAVDIRLDGTDDFWLSFITEDGATYDGYENVKVVNQDMFFTTFKKFMQQCGIIAWDPEVPSTSNVASTICGLYNYLPVQYSTEEGSLYKILTETYGVPVKMSLVGMFEDAKLGGKIHDTEIDSTGSPKNDAYRWAIDKYMAECNPEILAYTLDGAASVKSNPISQGTDAYNAKMNGIPNHDYFIAKQCFFFDVTSYAGEAPSDEPGQPLGADADTCKLVLSRRYEMAGGAFGMVIGFPPWHVKYTDFVPGGTEIPPRLEWHFVELCVSNNCGIEADAAHPCWMSNGSLYYKYKARYTSVPNAAADESVKYDPDTYYYCQAYAGDFDCSPWLKMRVPEVWTDKNLNNVTMCFNYSSTLIDRLPVAFDFIRSVRTDKQYFTAGEGAAYVMTSALFEGFTGKEFNPDYAATATGFKGTGYESVVHRTLTSGDRQYIHYLMPYMNDQKLDTYGRMIDGFTTIDKKDMILQNYLAPNGSLLHAWGGFIRQYNGVPYIHVDGYDNSAANRASSLYQNIMRTSSKFYAYGYFNLGTNAGTPSGYMEFKQEFEDYVASKNPGAKIKSVDIETFFRLLSESGRGEIVE